MLSLQYDSYYYYFYFLLLLFLFPQIELSHVRGILTVFLLHWIFSCAFKFLFKSSTCMEFFSMSLSLSIGFTGSVSAQTSNCPTLKQVSHWGYRVLQILDAIAIPQQHAVLWKWILGSILLIPHPNVLSLIHTPSLTSISRMQTSTSLQGIEESNEWKVTSKMVTSSGNSATKINK